MTTARRRRLGAHSVMRFRATVLLVLAAASLSACVSPLPLEAPPPARPTAAAPLPPPQQPPPSARPPSVLPPPPPAPCLPAPAFADAAAQNAASLQTSQWSLFGRPESGWEIYGPLTAHEIGTGCLADSEGFAAALASWQSGHGL